MKLTIKIFSAYLFIKIGLTSTVTGQNTFYKHLFYGYDGGRHSSIHECILVDDDELIVKYGILGHGADASGLSHYSDSGKKIGSFTPNDTFQLQFPERSEIKSFTKTSNGFLITRSTSNNTSQRDITTEYNNNLTQKWLLGDTILTNTSSTHNGITGLYSSVDFMRINKNGNRLLRFNFSNNIKVDYLNDSKKIFTGITKNHSYVIVSNHKDSVQTLKIDSLGNLIIDTIQTNLQMVDIRFFDDLIITVEKDTSYHIVFRDSSLKEKHRYSLSTEFEIRYDQLIRKDSLITLILYNEVDGKIYGTKNIPELRVIDLNGNYLRRRYLRYNGAYPGYKPYNATGPIINGIDYTSNYGYYLSMWLEAGTPDARYGLLKIDSNFLANDTIVIPVFRLYLNKPDSILTPFPPFSSLPFQSNSSENNITIFPNPASNQIFLSGLESNNTSFNIYNIEGKLVLSGTLGPENNLSVSELNAGTYILNLETAKGIIRKKILVE